MLNLEFKLQALQFPPYFVRFVERTSPGGLPFLLQTLTETQRLELNLFQKEFCEGFKFEQSNDLDHAVEFYNATLHRHPLFAFLIAEHLRYLETIHNQSLTPPPEGIA
ncbi:MAG: hypothetical protein K1X53_14550 [Candidatus Sumerlaeaceae bacterium]|nr:hypothetical protein [Candidatus Sumerlaeaceae bacterium]